MLHLFGFLSDFPNSGFYCFRGLVGLVSARSRADVDFFCGGERCEVLGGVKGDSGGDGSVCNLQEAGCWLSHCDEARFVGLG